MAAAEKMMHRPIFLPMPYWRAVDRITLSLIAFEKIPASTISRAIGKSGSA